MNETNSTRDDPPSPTPMLEETPPTVLLAGAPHPTQLGVYRILGHLGQGGMGTVYRAWHTRLKRIVALKTLRAECLDNAAAVARFNREMEAVGKFDHPNLIRATDAGEARGVHFLAMEFVEGLDAAKLTQRHGRLSVADACEVVRQAAVGLQYVHEHGLVHRDVKPSNLMVTPAGQVKVLDLGLALLHAAPDAEAELTAAGEWMGTADYAAPEQSLDAHRVDIRADIYSLGCTLYKLLSGQAPFGGPSYDTRQKKLEAHAQLPAPPLDARPDVPADLAAFLNRLLAKNPAERPATPGTVAAALEPFAIGCDLPRLVAAPKTAGLPREAAAADSVIVDTLPFGPRPPTSSLRESSAPLARPRHLVPGRRWWIAGAVCAAALAVALFGWWPRPSTGPVAPPRQWKRGVWQNVLDRPPEKLYWPQEAQPPAFDAEQQSLLVNCKSLGLLRLATLPDGPYQIQIAISQTGWTGGIGVFLGGREERDGNETVLRYQRFELVPEPRPANPRAQPTFALERIQGNLRKLPNGERLPKDKTLVHDTIGPLEDGHEYVLEMEVSRHGVLKVVRWNGQELRALASVEANRDFTPRDYTGDFGVFTLQGTGVFTNARVLLLKKVEP